MLLSTIFKTSILCLNLTLSRVIITLTLPIGAKLTQVFHGHFYVFTVLLFGLSSSPFILTKCLSPLVKIRREHGLNIVLYLDDSWCINHTYHSALADTNFVFESFRDAGFLVNIEKSVFTPTQALVWLGLC